MVADSRVGTDRNVENEWNLLLGGRDDEAENA